MIIAIVMAGGKGERLKANCEKPLFPIKDKSLIDYVLANLNESKLLDKIVVAVSPHTSKTKEYLNNEYKMNKIEYSDLDKSESKFSFLETPGNGYVDDLSYILDFFEKDSPNHVLLFINSDLPLVNAGLIDYVLDFYQKSSKQALSVSVPVEIFNQNNIDYSFELNGNVPSGLNILLSQNIIQEEEELIIPSIDLAFNVNTIDTATSISKFL